MHDNVRVKILISCILAAAAFIVLVFPTLAEFEEPKWRFFKPVVLPDKFENESLLSIVPDREIFTLALPKLSDLRVIEADSKQEIPYKLLVETGEKRRRLVELNIVNTAHVENQHSVFIIEFKEEVILHNELEIHTRSQNFERRVIIEASIDGKNWELLQDKGKIFDFTVTERNFKTTDTKVKYGDSTARHLKITVINDLNPPLDIEGIFAFLAQEIESQEIDFPTDIINHAENSVSQESEIILDLGEKGLPSNRIIVNISEMNFYRKVKLQGSNDQETWHSVQNHGVLYRYNTEKFSGENLALSYPESSFRYLRIKISNEDDAPLTVRNIRVLGFLHKLIFRANPEKTYRLYYGHETAQIPSYDLERFFPYLITDNLPTGHLGERVDNPLYKTRLDPFTERHSWILPTAVGVVSLITGLFLTNLLRRTRKFLPPRT